MEIIYNKVRPNAVLPTKRIEDAGYDLYPSIYDEFLEDYCGYIVNDCFIPFKAFHGIVQPDAELLIAWNPGEIIKVPLGLKTQFGNNYVGILKERGSTGTKGLAVRSGVMDSGYRGEWFAVIENCTSKMAYYPVHKAIAQLLVLEGCEVNFKEGELEASERGEGAWGSSGK